MLILTASSFSLLSLMVIFGTRNEVIFIQCKCLSKCHLFFSYWNVTFPCSNVNFESLVLQYVHHISLGRPIKLTTHVMELHCYASFDLSIGLLDRKVCNKKKELPNLCAVSKLSKCIILFLVICLKCLIQVCRIVFIVFHYQHSKLHYLCGRESFTAYKVCLI